MSGDNKSIRLILGSGSPRREELLKTLGLKFEIVTSTVDEEIDHSLEPEILVVELARQKAEDVMSRVLAEGNGVPDSALDMDLLVLGADTLVVFDGQYLGKPKDEQEAKSMLRSLSGKWHEVFTGVVLLCRRTPSGDLKALTSCERSRVLFRGLDEREIDAYVATGEPMDKAGAYALQGIASAMVASIEGSHTNIVGLPIPNVVQLLRQGGYRVLGLP